MKLVKCSRQFFIIFFIIPLALLLARYPSVAQTPPEGFTSTVVGSNWDQPTGLTFAEDGRMFVWEKLGKVWLVENDKKASTPFIDISEEVGDWRDHGLLGFALDPDFYRNGYFYLLYAVDRHHLTKYGTAAYNAATNDYFNATIGRLTRYQAKESSQFRTVDLASRKVLLGESITTGIPILSTTHGVGSLVFGSDGTLLVSCGDGASAATMDGGTAQSSYYLQALTDGIITGNQNAGAYRAQLIDALSGKILRLDPMTGDGLSSNPFFDPSQPRAARSRVWALGLRNPFRITKRPDTGSKNPADANPGVLYIGDVGWSSWEEMNVADSPGLNFGWPLFEGFDLNQGGYNAVAIPNKYAPNPLYNTGGCTQKFFAFSDLLKQATLDSDIPFMNPCQSEEPIPANIPHFIHTRPVFDWRTNRASRTGSFAGNFARADTMGISSSVTGARFGGNCSVGGVWYSGSSFPADYHTSYFHSDFGQGWIRRFVFDGFNRPIKVEKFIDTKANAVSMAIHPLTGELYYTKIGAEEPSIQEIRKVAYSANRQPIAVATANKKYGSSPLSVQFDGSGSSDSEGKLLMYEWDFGDGLPISKESSPTHTFTSIPTKAVLYTVTLKVSDASGNSATTTLPISLNNTPPTVAITNPADNAVYPLGVDTTFSLKATATDAEHPEAGLTYSWQVILHHNMHVHEEPKDTNRSTSAFISPLGCDGETYFYTIVLTVTDAAGLSGSDYISLLPNCHPSLTISNLTVQPGNQQVQLRWTNPMQSFDEVMIVAKPFRGIRLVPVGDGVEYKQDNNFAGNGTPYDSGKVVYKGKVSEQTITGLTNTTPYFFRVFTRAGIDWSTGKEVNATPSNITGIEELTRRSLIVFPNPAQQAFSIRIKGYAGSQKIQLALYNSVGQSVVEQTMIASTDDPEITIPVNTLAPGLYFLCIWLNDETVMRKIVIRRD